jgi:hypothetical protein
MSWRTPPIACSILIVLITVYIFAPPIAMVSAKNKNALRLVGYCLPVSSTAAAHSPTAPIACVDRSIRRPRRSPHSPPALASGNALREYRKSIPEKPQ